VEKPTSKDEVNTVLKAAALGRMAGNMGFCEEPLVSVDFVSTAYGGVVDSLLTTVMDKTMVKLILWYDNEGGYANQVLRLVKKVAKAL
jgi:glyceraldehyde 3-phosphate dehydrogenase